jgi:hypothetical protein
MFYGETAFYHDEIEYSEDGKHGERWEKHGKKMTRRVGIGSQDCGTGGKIGRVETIQDFCRTDP